MLSTLFKNTINSEFCFDDDQKENVKIAEGVSYTFSRWVAEIELIPLFIAYKILSRCIHLRCLPAYYCRLSINAPPIPAKYPTGLYYPVTGN